MIIIQICIIFKNTITIGKFNKGFDDNVETWTRTGNNYKHTSQWYNYIQYQHTSLDNYILVFKQIIKDEEEVNFVIGRFIEIVCSHFEVEKIKFEY